MGLLKQNRCKMCCETLMWDFELSNLSKEAVPRNFSQFPCQISAFCTQGWLLNWGEILQCRALKQLISKKNPSKPPIKALGREQAMDGEKIFTACPIPGRAAGTAASLLLAKVIFGTWNFDQAPNLTRAPVIPEWHKGVAGKGARE